MSNIPLGHGADAFPLHVFDAFGTLPDVFTERIGGSVMVVAKDPEGGPRTLITSGASRLPVDSGLPVELAVEVLPDQEGAGVVALRIVCDDMAQNRRTPPVGAPWRGDTPFLNGTEISALLATGSRWGASFDEIRDDAGTLVGHVRTLRLLTDAEAAFAGEQGFGALVRAAGSLDGLVDVTRSGVVSAP